MRSGSGSDVGQQRSKNEDSFLRDEEHQLFVVADGMGGHPAGEVASRDAVAALEEALSDGCLDDPRDRTGVLRDALIAANEAVVAAGTSDPTKRGMGTTAVVVHLDETESLLTCAHIGDSRAYVLRDGELSQITEDHSLPDGGGHSLTRALGSSRDVEPDVAQRDVRPGDKVLICTDGLTDMLVDGDIRDIVAKDGHPQALCDELIDAALERGGADNITCIVIDI